MKLDEKLRSTDGNIGLAKNDKKEQDKYIIFILFCLYLCQ